MIEVRLATESDIPLMLDISNKEAKNSIANFSVEPESLDDWIALYKSIFPDFPWLVACNVEDIVGIARSTPWKGRCAYEHAAEVGVYNKPSFQQQGIGRKLYE